MAFLLVVCGIKKVPETVVFATELVDPLFHLPAALGEDLLPMNTSPGLEWAPDGGCGALSWD